MQSIVSKGKSVKEAVHLGLELMEVKKNEVSIEIIQYGTKGFFGIGGKNAVVKLSKQESNTTSRQSKTNSIDYYKTMEHLVDDLPFEQSSVFEGYPIDYAIDVSQKEMTEQELEGKAWVTDGTIYVKDSETQYPIVEIGKGVQLFKNNQMVKEKKTIVSEKDALEITLEDEQQDTRWNITIDQHKLNVLLEVNPGHTITRKLQDVEPNQQIELTVDEHKETINTLTYEDIRNKMETLRITYGINQNEIRKALETNVPSSYEIATGSKAKPGVDGRIELMVEVDTKNGLIEDDAGKVDFRELKMIPTVEEGQIIAIIHPPIPGKRGTTVTNEPLPAKETHPIVLKSEIGVTVVEDNIIATTAGRPFVEQRGPFIKASVIPKLVHNGNVDISSGNIRFDGDIEIRGEVEENMIVEGGGDIIIYKSASDATITTSKSIITYGNVTGSELSAGKSNMLITELGHLLGIIQIQVEKMISFIKQLSQSPAFKSSDFSRGGLNPLIHILLEKKFNSFLPLAKKYVEVTRKGEEYLEEEDWRKVATSIQQIFLTLSNQTTSLEQLKILSRKMKELHEYSKTPIEPDSYITISNALNSSLYCSGNILIIGQGCVNTKVHSGGQLKITGSVRGGEVYGRQGAEIKESGSNSGTKTVIAVPSDQKIRIGRAFEGTVLKIGHIQHIVKENRNNITARINSEGQIVFE
ncbi:FapA family protein [Aquibacillus sp. 3ASR75-11]|uniref:FapA family protein n=1 Tax=Terrihalobacillus insolitus TaxID=2950438 RepID=A0A9X4AMW9_9BACI|nr:FapA family protein [Terrihalobacillus insolitus]MDC3425887.1 FapA family protein [Terrihalobacillus insolitus]